MMRYKEIVNELAYPGNIGMMEMVKFYKVATAEQKVHLKKLIADKQMEQAWAYLQAVTKVELNEYERDTDNSREIFSKLQQLGYEKLGSGQDATVWSKDEASVIKILMPTDKPHNAENGFLTFYAFCQQHKDVPNLPKFVDIGGKHHTVFNINGTDYRQIAMERLQPIANNSFEEAMVWIMSDYADKNVRWERFVQVLTRSDWTRGLTSTFATQAVEQVRLRANDEEFNATYGLLFVIMQMLYQTGRKAGLGWDLHTENVMQRKDGTLVIVDPFYS